MAPGARSKTNLKEDEPALLKPKRIRVEKRSQLGGEKTMLEGLEGHRNLFPSARGKISEPTCRNALGWLKASRGDSEKNHGCLGKGEEPGGE